MNYNENADNDSNCRDAIILIAMVPPISRVHFFMIISTFFFFLFPLSCLISSTVHQLFVP